MDFKYLIDMLTLCKPIRNSHDQTQLVVSKFNISLSGQCFSINMLPKYGMSYLSLSDLKINLKPISFVKVWLIYNCVIVIHVLSLIL